MTTHRSPQCGKPPSDAGFALWPLRYSWGSGLGLLPQPFHAKDLPGRKWVQGAGRVSDSPSSEGWSPRKFVPPPHPQPRTVSTAELS